MAINARYPAIHIGVSSCLLGELVRYDGGHRRHDAVSDMLQHYFTLHPFCPEVAVGMGIPRPPIQLVKLGNVIHARGVDDPQRDITTALSDYGKKIAMAYTQLSGFIFKARSPSCGINTTPLFDDTNIQIGMTTGLFAAQIKLRFPDMPVIDETQLDDERVCDGFIEAVIRYHDGQSGESEK